jgi:RNA polymerase sigma-70 factor (ECF subfamily)
VTTKTWPSRNPSDDAALVNAAKQGDAAAFEALVKRHTEMIFRIVLHIAGSREDAEDIVQEAFIKAYTHLHNFEERSLFSTWLTRIAVNQALMKLRSSRRAPVVAIDDGSDESWPLADRIADWRPDPEQLYSRAQLNGILREAFASLPDSYRVVFLWRDIEGLSIVETAGLLGLSISCVKSRLLHARLKLRRRLSQQFAGRVAGAELPPNCEAILRESRVA